MTLKAFLGATALTLATVLAASAHATTINFDEFAAFDDGHALTNEYTTTIGATFAGADVGTWGGNSNGDPGNWSLEGTNGPQFLGFNGGDYTETVSFNSEITSFSADFARSQGSGDGQITLNAFHGATLVASASVNLGALGDWSNLAVFGPGIDSVSWTGSGLDFHPFGVDNLVFGDRAGGVPEPASWAMMLVGFGGLGAVLRRRRILAGVAAT